jgi:hypothetical protein
MNLGDNAAKPCVQGDSRPVSSCPTVPQEQRNKRDRCPSHAGAEPNSPRASARLFHPFLARMQEDGQESRQQHDGRGFRHALGRRNDWHRRHTRWRIRG